MGRIDGGLRAELVKRLRLPDWEITAVESGGTVSGIPDTYWSHASGASGWLELKQTSGWAVEIRPHQVGWLTRHAARGVDCKLAVRVLGRGSSLGRGDGLVLCAGAAAGALAAGGLLRGSGGDGALGAWYGAPREWDWDAIAAALLHPSSR